jgi:acyl phosphate:glycerol-3-phosphate acyltransferase
MVWIKQLQFLDWAHGSVCFLAAYALGCLTSGYYLVRAMTGRDVRHVDSGSVGARNVGRVLGRSGFLITLMGDLGKGALAVWICRHFTGSQSIAGLAMLAVVAGHIWPVQLGFHGGKGATTSLGALLVWDYHLLFAFVAFFLVAFAMTRKTTLPGLFAFACLPVATFWLTRDGLVFTIIVALVAMVLFAHRKNIIEEIPALAARYGTETKTNGPKI